MKKVATYEEFLTEGFANPIASVVNTSGMGNVGPGMTEVSEDDDSGDQDSAAKHLRMHETAHRSDAWMRPRGDYSHRNWILPNLQAYMNERQSNARFQIGQEIRCIDPMKECYGMTGKIVAFEDNTIRWEATNSATGVGQGAKQYRCHAAQLELVG